MCCTKYLRIMQSITNLHFQTLSKHWWNAAELQSHSDWVTRKSTKWSIFSITRLFQNFLIYLPKPVTTLVAWASNQGPFSDLDLLSSYYWVTFIFLIFAPNNQSHLVSGLSLFFLPWGFQFRSCLVVQFSGLRKVCSI